MKSIQDFLLARSDLFNRVVFRKYDCSQGILINVHNLNTRTNSFLEGLSALMFESLAKGSNDEIMRFMESEDLREQEVLEFIHELTELEILNSKSNPAGFTKHSEKTDISDSYRDSLEQLYDNGYLSHIHLDITNQCNLRCRHCYHPFDEYQQEKQLTLAEMEKIIDDAHAMGVFSVVISGGEVMLSPDIFEILEYVTKKGMIIDIYTNATLIDEKVTDRLKSYNIQRIGVSLYSADRNTHEAITTVKGSFDKTLSAIQTLANNGFNVEIKCMLMNENFKCYKEMMTIADTLGCTLKFDTSMTPKLNGDVSPMNLHLNPEQYRQLCKDPSTAHYADKINGVKPDDAPCNAGRYSLYYDSNGNIYPCVSFRTLLGTHKDGLNDIWLNSPVLNEWRKMKNSDFVGYGIHSYCQHCVEICAGIAQLENGVYTHCEKSDCFKAKVRESVYNELKGGCWHEKINS